MEVTSSALMERGKLGSIDVGGIRLGPMGASFSEAGEVTAHHGHNLGSAPGQEPVSPKVSFVIRDSGDGLPNEWGK